MPNELQVLLDAMDELLLNAERTRALDIDRSGDLVPRFIVNRLREARARYLQSLAQNIWVEKEQGETD